MFEHFFEVGNQSLRYLDPLRASRQTMLHCQLWYSDGPAGHFSERHWRQGSLLYGRCPEGWRSQRQIANDVICNYS